ncbi:MAG: hypothetical protein O2780_18535 [Proteobacteria bacterium]|jgi:hypothetical protein|nr:hypothetical protein [Pseudomonadota bacterium]MDA1302229.1 hypothetical protein [Pseudomonadota bacterium]
MKCSKSLLLMCCLLFSSSLQALDYGVDFGQINDCREINRDIIRNWLTLKGHLAPGYEDEVIVKKNGKKKYVRPNRKDFQCISAAYMRGLNEVSSRGTLTLRCFSHPEVEAGYCCDKALTACAMYSPNAR